MKVNTLSLLAATLLVGDGSAFTSPMARRQVGTELFARKPFITGNWKLNPSTKDEALTLATGIAEAVTPDSPCDVALFVPFPFMETVMNSVGDKLEVGAEVRNWFLL